MRLIAREYCKCWIDITFPLTANEQLPAGLSTLAGGGGYPVPGLWVRGEPHLRSGWGGTPSQAWVGGYPILGLGGGYPIPGLDGGVPRGTLTRSGWGVPGIIPDQVWMVGGVPGIPPNHQDWMGYPPPTHPPIRQSSIASTCYTVGGVPLAFMQEDFLVKFFFAYYFHAFTCA